MYSVQLRNFCLISFYCMYLFSGGAREYEWGLSEDNLIVSYLFLPCGSQGLELRLNSKCLYSLSHLTGLLYLISVVLNLHNHMQLVAFMTVQVLGQTVVFISTMCLCTFFVIFLPILQGHKMITFVNWRLETRTEIYPFRCILYKPLHP